MNSEESWTTKRTWVTMRAVVVLLFRKLGPYSSKMKRRHLRRKTKLVQRLK